MAHRDYNEKAKPVWFDNADDFGFGLMVEPWPLVELGGFYPLSTSRDLIREVATGAVTDATADEHRVRCATGGDEASLLSARRGRYVPGVMGLAGISVRLAGEITDDSSFAEWGYFDEDSNGDVNNGFLFGVDASGPYIAVVKGGTTVHSVYAGDWNVKPNAVDPASGVGTIFRIAFTHYGYGAVRWYVMQGETDEPYQFPELVHVWAPGDNTSVTNPNLQVGARVGSVSGSDDFSVYLGGRHFHLLGKYSPHQRVSGEFASATSVGTTMVPLVSFRRKSAATWEPVTIVPRGFDAIVSGNNMIVEIRLNSTLTGASFGALTHQPAGETSLEVDTSATAVNAATGVMLWSGLFEAGGGHKTVSATVSELGVEMPGDSVISVCAHAVTATADIEVFARMLEEW